MKKKIWERPSDHAPLETQLTLRAEYGQYSSFSI